MDFIWWKIYLQNNWNPVKHGAADDIPKINSSHPYTFKFLIRLIKLSILFYVQLLLVA